LLIGTNLCKYKPVMTLYILLYAERVCPFDLYLGLFIIL